MFVWKICPPADEQCPCQWFDMVMNDNIIIIIIVIIIFWVKQNIV
jgi:hypothetical protein